MTADRQTGAFFLSLMIHGLAISLIFLAAYIANQSTPATQHVFELVAVAGENYAATVAPAGGTPMVAKNVAQAIAQKTARLEAVYQKQLAAERQKEAVAQKQADAQRKVESPAQKQTSYQEFEKEHSRPDADASREGVVGGSEANKSGGAGGKALVRDEGSLLDSYFELLRQHIRENCVAPEGVSDRLVTKVSFYVASDGSLSRSKIVHSSGNPQWDQAVLEAIERTRSIGPRPDNRGDEVVTEVRSSTEE